MTENIINFITIISISIGLIGIRDIYPRIFKQIRALFPQKKGYIYVDKLPKKLNKQFSKY